MPEFPEVNVQVRYLRERCVGWTLSGWGVKTRQHFKGMDSPGRDAALGDFFTGAVLEDVTQRGKQIVMRTNRGLLLSHLMFRGRWSVQGDEFRSPYKYHATAPTERSISFWLEGDGGRRLNLHTPENKAHVTAFLNQRDPGQLEKLTRLGPEVLVLPETDPAFAQGAWSLEQFAARAGRSRQAIKAFLLDQKRQSGLGNMYVCEGLYDAGIAPTRPANSLSAAEREAIWGAARAIMQRAVTEELNYESLLRVYRRDKDPEGHDVENTTISGRATYWVPARQS